MVGRCLPTHGVAWWATCVLDKLPPTLQGWSWPHPGPDSPSVNGTEGQGRVTVTWDQPKSLMAGKKVTLLCTLSKGAPPLSATTHHSHLPSINSSSNQRP